MKNIFSTLTPAALLAMGTLSIASATTVTYNTTGAFNCNGVVGCSASGNTATVGGLTLTYEVQGSTTVNANPVVSANYGGISVTGSSNTAITSLSNLLLDITVNQTGPFVQSSGIFSGILTGALGITNGFSDGFASICFVANAACANQVEAFTYTSTGDTVTYKLQTPSNPNAPPANGYVVRATSDNIGAPTTFQGSIAAPEPSSYLMLGSGLIGLGFMGRRKKVS